MMNMYACTLYIHVSWHDYILGAKLVRPARRGGGLPLRHQFCKELFSIFILHLYIVQVVPLSVPELATRRLHLF